MCLCYIVGLFSCFFVSFVFVFACLDLGCLLLGYLLEVCCCELLMGCLYGVSFNSVVSFFVIQVSFVVCFDVNLCVEVLVC